MELTRSRAIAAVSAGLLILLVWVLWPSRFSRVTNLDSRGSAVIAFGDSLTAGYGASSGEDYPTRLAQRLGITVLNAGVSGDTTETALARLGSDVLTRDPRIVIIGLGGNDFLRQLPISETEANLRSIVRKIQGAGAMVVLLGFRFPSFSANYEEIYERVGSEERCLLIPDILDGILSEPSLRSDGIHPNARGYALMSERISGPFRKLLKKADSTR